MKNAENRINLIKKPEGIELDESELEKVDGGKKVVIDKEGKQGYCTICGRYSTMYGGYCYSCKDKEH